VSLMSTRTLRRPIVDATDDGRADGMTTAVDRTLRLPSAVTFRYLAHVAAMLLTTR